jgi:hypothetical protein
VTPQKNTEISPLFKCDSSTRAFYGLKDGKITVNFSGWEQNRVVLEGQAFEVRWGRPQGVAGANGGHVPESGARKGAVT